MNAVLLSFPALLVAHVSTVDRLSLTPFALTGSPAPMQLPGVIYQHFGVHPVGQSAGFVRPPARIARDGQIAFNAWIGEELNVPASPAAAQNALFAGNPASLRFLLNTSDNVPGAGSRIFNDPIFGVRPLPYSYNGRTTVPATLSDDAFTFEINTILREATPGNFDILVQAGDFLPGMRPNAKLFGHLFASFDAEDLYLFSVIDDNLADDLDPSGFWRFRDEQPAQPIAVVDNQVPGRDAGIVWGQISTSQRLGVVASFDTFDDGRLAFVGINKGDGITPTNDEGIWIEQPDGSFQPFLLEGSPAPSHPEIEPGSLFVSSSAADGAFTSLAGIHTNSQGDLVFTGLVDPGSAPDQPRMPTVWTTRDGDLELIARGFRMVLGFRPGTPAPGIPGAPQPLIRETVSHEISDDGDILMFSVIQYDLNNPFNSNFAVIADRRAGLESLSYDGGPVPGLPGAVWVDPRFAPVPGIFDVKLLPDGSALISGNAVFEGFTRATVVHVPAIDDPTLIARATFDIDLFGDGLDIREVAGILLGEGVADDGTTTLELTFADGSRGLFTLSINPACNDADLAEPFNQLDFSDVIAFLTAFANADPAADLAPPLGSLDFSDVLAFLSAFTSGCP